MQNDHHRRKACDLCYIRKLKCDTSKPRCSNCVSYSTECTHRAESRKWKPRRRATRPAAEEQHDDAPEEIQQTRAANASASAHSLPGRWPMSELGSDVGTKHRALALPSLTECLAMVSIYLSHFNSHLPLFDSASLLRLVGDCYAQQPHQRNPVTWAAINVVLALAHQQTSTERANGRVTATPAEFLTRAQSVLSYLTLGDITLLHVQTLLGMVFLLQTAHDATPALLLLSATVRLVHKLGLHSRSLAAGLDAAEPRQRDRVFWIAYILDKTLSLRTQQPSLQRDDDIDIGLPHTGGDNDDDAGVVIAADGARMDYFLARAQLAVIEGGVYDYLYSNRAAGRTAEERAVARESLVRTLDDWSASIPPEFWAGAVAGKIDEARGGPAFFCVLHATRLQCRTLVSQSHAWDKEWVRSLDSRASTSLALKLPSGWNSLVAEAREFMMLFKGVWRDDAWYRWMTSCSYISAVILLIANDLCNLTDSESQTHAQLIDAALVWLGDRLAEDPREDVRQVREACLGAVHEIRRRSVSAGTVAHKSTRSAGSNGGKAIHYREMAM